MRKVSSVIKNIFLFLITIIILYSFSNKGDNNIIKKLILIDTSYSKLDSYITDLSLTLIDYNNKDTVILHEFIYSLTRNSIMSDYQINVKDTFDLIFRYICWNIKKLEYYSNNKNKFYVFDHMDFYDSARCRPILGSYKTPKKKKKLIPRINAGVLGGQIIQYVSKQSYNLRN